MDLDAIFYIGYATAITMLAITSYIDVRTREIDPRIWLPFIAIGIALAIYRYQLDPGTTPLYIAISMISPAVLLAMSLIGMMGLADPIAMAIVALLIPKPPGSLVLPPSLVILAISTILMVVGLVIPISILNLWSMGEIRRHCRSLYKAVIVHMTGFPIKAERFIATRFLYPLIYPSLENGSIIWRCRESFDINEDPSIYRGNVRELIEKGLLRGDERIYVTWGVPYILFILLGTALYPLSAGYVEGVFESLSRIFSTG
ncbi:MAG: A24 family peptidase C-terminal domain-containing protein [Sulfolobales archaeon]